MAVAVGNVDVVLRTWVYPISWRIWHSFRLYLGRNPRDECLPEYGRERVMGVCLVARLGVLGWGWDRSVDGGVGLVLGFGKLLELR